MLTRRDLIRTASALGLAAAAWTPSVHRLFEAPDRTTLRRQLAERHLRMWEDPELRSREQARMRANNAEWDFMGRAFLVLALANLLDDDGLADRCATGMRRILDDTLQVEADRGQEHFLLPSSYGLATQFRDPSARSVFVDGELALALAAYRLATGDSRYDGALETRVERISRAFEAAPLGFAESYPNECWTFCNTVAVAALRRHEQAMGADHSRAITRWLQQARRHLVDPDSGMLISSFTWDGQVLDGPEGSSIWVVSHFLAELDPAWAADQYERARRALGREFFGFGYAREWRPGGEGVADIDSGPIVPVFHASAGSSGCALLAAQTFADTDWSASLLRSLEAAAFPIRRGGALHYAGGNQVGDAMLLYALTVGPEVLT